MKRRGNILAVAIVSLLLMSEFATFAPVGASALSTFPQTPGRTTYSLGWGGGSTLPLLHENDTVFQKFWLNEGIGYSIPGDGSFWIQNSSLVNTVCTVPWRLYNVNDLTLADKYGVSVAFQVPYAFTNYGDSSYAGIATGSYRNSLTTYDKFGNPAQGYVRVDTPLFGNLVYNDLIATLQCYGRFKSWIGISQSYNDADLGGLDMGVIRTHNLGNDTIHSWLGNPYFYTSSGNDSLTYSITSKTPIVRSTSVYNNIVAYHLQDFVNYINWAEMNQVQLALNRFQIHTGKALIYVDYDHEGTDRYYNFPPTTRATLLSNLTALTLSGASCINSIVNNMACVVNTMGSVNPSAEDHLTWAVGMNSCLNGYPDTPRQAIWNILYTYAYYAARKTQLTVDNSALSCSGLENVNSNEFKMLTQYGGVLNRMRDVGSYYGPGDPAAPRVLFIYQASGSTGNIGGQLSQFLGGNANVTVTSDMTLTAIDLSKFNAILYAPYSGMGGGTSGGVLTPSAVSRVSSFIAAGGGFVAIPGNINSLWNVPLWNSEWSSIFGVKANSLSGFVGGGTISLLKPGSVILKPYGSSVTQGGYSPGLSGGSSTGTISYTQTSSALSVIFSSSKLGPEVWTNNYGLGRVVMLPGSGSDSIYGISSFDAYWTLVNNAVFYASKQESRIPMMWFPSFKGEALHESWDQSTMFSIMGSPSAGLLVWFFTNKTSSDNINLHLNATDYHLGGNGWIAVSARDWTVVGEGKGADVSLSLSIPAQNWVPVYVVGIGTDKQLLYSNGVSLQSLLGAVSTYVLETPSHFSGWAVVRRSSAPFAVSSSNSGPIPQLTDLAALNRSVIGFSYAGGAWRNSTSTGWYYDTNNGLLYVHFQGSPRVQLAVFDSSTSSSSTSSLSSSNSSSSSSSSTTHWSSSTISSTTSTSATSSITGSWSISGGGFNFELSASNYSVTILQGSSWSGDISASLLGGSPSEVALYASNLPQGVTASFSIPSGLPSFTSSVTLAATVPASPGSYSIRLGGSGNGLVRTLDLSLTVIALQPVNYSLIVSGFPAGGGNMIPAPGSYSFLSRTNVTLHAVPATHWHFDHWTVNGQYGGNGSLISLMLLENISVTGYFSPGDSGPIQAASVSFATDTTLSSVVTIDGKNFSTPISFSWVLGSQHSVSVPTVVYQGARSRLVFQGWSGVYSGTKASLSLVVEGDSEVLPIYSTQYLTNLRFVDCTGKTFTPDNVVLSGITRVPSTLSLWLVSGEVFHVTEVDQLAVNVASLSGLAQSFTISGPQTVLLPEPVCTSTLYVRDVLGVPAAGAAVTLTFPNSIQVANNTDSNGMVTFARLPQTTFAGSVVYMGMSNGFAGDLGQQETYNVSALVSPSTLTALALGLIFSLALLFVRGRLRGRRDSGFGYL